MSQAQRSLVVEGWRGINHSFAIVNQFQLLAMRRHPGLALWHTDAPFHFAHWSRTTNSVGFHPADEDYLAGLAPAQPQTRAEWTYRIFSAADLRPAQHSARLAVFLVTELGLDHGSFVPGSDIRSFEAAGHLIITPSRWARDRIIDWGFQPDTVHVVGHGASDDYFRPLAEPLRRQQRGVLGFRDDETLLLNIGAAIWNKGIDVLLTAFAMARQQRKDLRLIFKDQRHTYGIAGEGFVQATLAQAGLLTQDVLDAITLIPANLNMDQMNVMYAIADCYVSPYRAEGFNLPVLEAMTCQTPVIVTRGGATDDFVPDHDLCRKIEARLHEHTQVQDRQVSAYLEPDLQHLVELLLATHPKGGSTTPPAHCPQWNAVTDTLLRTLAMT